MSPMRALNCSGLMLLGATLLAVTPLRGVVELDASFGVTDEDYIGLGANYPSVGIFSSPGGAESGVLIAPNWVLTAAHVANAQTIGTSVFIVGGSNYSFDSIIIYPGYTSTPISNDLALVHLTSPVSNVTPAVLYNESNEVTTLATWVGAGQTGTGLTGQNGTGDGTIRGGTNVVDAFGYTSQYPVPNVYFTSDSTLGTFLIADFDDNTGANNSLAQYGSSAVTTSLECGLGVGDSGGGVFGDFGQGPVLIGINEFIDPGNGSGSATQYGAVIGATRVSAYFSWIEQQIANPSAGGPAITTQATNAAAIAGNSVAFTVAASGTPAPTFQWQVSSDGGHGWNNAGSAAYAGSTTATLTISNPTTSMLGYEFRVIMTNSVGIAVSAPVSLVVAFSQAQLAWLNNNFTTAQLGDPNIVGNAATPAHDGIANLLKYAFNLSPFQNGQPFLPQLSASGGNLEMTFATPPGDLSWSVEASTDLVIWSTTGVTTQTNGTQVTADYPISTIGAVFMRTTVAPAP